MDVVLSYEEEFPDIIIGFSEFDITKDYYFYFTSSVAEEDDDDGGKATTHYWYSPALDIYLGRAGRILIATLMFPFYFDYIISIILIGSF